jgi:beta-galactosidase
LWLEERKKRREKRDVLSSTTAATCRKTILSPLSSLLSPLKSDGNDLAFVTVQLVDQDGTFIPDAQDQLTFEVSGAGTFRAVCNGDATSLEPFTEPTMRLFNGQLVVIVEAGHQPGDLVLKVNDAQRKLSQTITIPVK